MSIRTTTAHGLHQQRPTADDGCSAWPWRYDGQKFKVQKARSSEGSAGRKSVNEIKNGKSACFVFGGCRKPLSAPPSRRRKGRNGDPRLAPDGPGPEKFRPRLRGVMISRRGRGKKCYHTFIFINNYKKKITKSVMFLVSHKGKIDF